MVSTRVRMMLTAGLACLATAGVTVAVSAQRRGDERGMGGVGITVFSEANFRGVNSNFRADVPDLRRYNLNDRVDSLLIARGEVWEVCVDVNYRGRCQVFTGDQPDLGRVGWGGLISSLRRLPNDDRRGGRELPFAPMRPRLVLFDDAGFRGRSFVVDDTVPALRALGNRARSAKVYGGSWELCDGDRFRGRCVTVRDSVADLGRVGMRDRVSSVRPIGRDR
jgi:hypothetical protein